MRRQKPRPLAKTKVIDDTVYFFDKITYPNTYCLSPFYKCRFYLDENWWTSVIHYYQANKTEKNNTIYLQIRDAESPEDAKRIGSTLKSMPFWLDNRLALMEKATYAKFSQNRDCMNVLISTGTKPLVEYSHDKFWGGRNFGENNMGKILMRVRTQLRIKLRME